MPLIKSKSKEAFSSNVSEMIKAGHPRDQALAAAYRIARKQTGGAVRRRYAEGGEVQEIIPPPENPMNPPPWARGAVRAVVDPIIEASKAQSPQELLKPVVEAIGPGAAKAIFVGPMGAMMARGTTKMHPAVRANLAPELASAISGIKDPGMREATAGGIQATRDAAARGILEMRRAAGNPEDKDMWKYAGWHVGEEGAAKKEIPDMGAKLVPTGEFRKGDYGVSNEVYKIQHPQIDLYKAYDNLPEIVIDRGARHRGKHDPTENRITLQKPEVGVALHELTHAIQKREGFSRGSNLHKALDSPALERELGRPLTQSEKQGVQVALTFGLRDPAVDDNVFKAVERTYKNWAGEIEAENVRFRRGSAYKYLAHPRLTEETPAGLQIVEKEGTPAGWMGKAMGGSIDRTARKYATGGAPWETRAAARQIGRGGAGYLSSSVPGRTDKLPIAVGSGSYVLPADHVSAIGQNNSEAGAAILSKMFTGPYGIKSGSGRGASRIGAGRPPRGARISMRAEGGGVGEEVPIVAAGGEFVLTPEQVTDIGNGDIKRGHAVLDNWVVQTRKKHIKTLRTMKPPKKS